MDILLDNETTLEDGEERGVVSGALDTATCCRWLGGVNAPPREVQLAELDGLKIPASRVLQTGALAGLKTSTTEVLQLDALAGRETNRTAHDVVNVNESHDALALNRIASVHAGEKETNRIMLAAGNESYLTQRAEENQIVSRPGLETNRTATSAATRIKSHLVNVRKQRASSRGHIRESRCAAQENDRGVSR